MEENQIFIPEGWAKQKGDNLFKVQGGYAFKSNDYKDEGVLLVRISNVGNNNFIYKDLIYVPKRFLTSHSNFLLDKDDVLMGLTGDLGKICILENGEFPFILNQRVGRFIFNEKVSNRFLYYLISSSTIQNKFDAFFTGGAQKNISPKQIESVEYVVPKSTTEQTAIATILSKTVQAIANTEALIAKYTRIKTGLMKDLLTKGIDENGNIRSEQSHEFKDSPLGRIPKEWECEKLSDFCNEKYLGSVQTGPFGSQLHFSDYKNEGTPIITVEHLKNENISHQDLPLVGKEDYIRLKKYNLITGDLVFSRVGAIDRCSIVTEKENNWLFSGRCLRVRPGNQFNSEYLLRQMNFDFVRSQINNNAVGSTMKCLNTQILSDILIVKPKITEQERIVLLFNKSNELISKIETELSKLQSLKTGLMQDLLSGKVRVNNLKMKRNE